MLTGNAAQNCTICLHWPTGPCPLCFWGPENAPQAERELARALVACNTERVRRHDPEWLRARHLTIAFDLSPDLDTWRALMLGERLPLTRLNPDAVQRYGLR